MNTDGISECIGMCKRCGHCCTSAFFALTDRPADEDNLELARWISYHGCEVMKYHSAQVNKEVLSIRIPIVCQHLKRENGVYTCAIYENRPKVCRDYLCKDAMNEGVVELVEDFIRNNPEKVLRDKQPQPAK